MHSLPAAHIIPADITGDQRYAAGFFQYAVIDGNGRHGGKMLFYGLLECSRSAAFGNDGLNHLMHFRQILLNLCEY